MKIKINQLLIKRVIYLLVFLEIFLLTSCLNSPKPNTERTPSKSLAEAEPMMGRYAQTECKLDKKALFSQLPFVNNDRSLSLLIYTADEWENDARQIQGMHETSILEYQLSNGGNWTKKDSSFADQLSGKTSISNVCFEGSDAYFVFVKTWHGIASQHIGKIDQYGKFTELPINLGKYSSKMMERNIFAENLEAEENDIVFSGDDSVNVGQLFVTKNYIYILDRGSILVYRLNGSLVNAFGSGESQFALQGERIITTNDTGTLIRTYDQEGHKLIKEVNHSLPERVIALATDQTGKLFIATKKGIYRQNTNNEKWDMVVVSQGTSLCDSSIMLSNLYCLPDEKFALSGFDAYRAGYGLCRVFLYEYDSQLSTQRTSALSVATLYPNETLVNTALEMEKNDKNLSVEITVLTEQYPDLPIASIVNTLNTQLLAGEGPDVLLLDELPMQAYMKQHLLAGLDDFILSKIEKDNYYNNMITAHRYSDQTMVLPISFELPVSASFFFPGGKVNMEYYQSLDADVDTTD